MARRPGKKSGKGPAGLAVTAAAAASLHTLRDWWRFAMSAMNRAGVSHGHGCPDAIDEAAWMLCHLLQLPAQRLETFADARLAPEEIATIRRALHRRIGERIPMAYLLGEAWLGDQNFICDPRALVPRSFIAPLLAQGLLPWLDPSQGADSILELCTGGGSLAILAALHFPEASVTATDLSPAALSLAGDNVALYGLEERITLLQGDLFAPLPAGTVFDVILANPPYVDAVAMAHLPEEYRHEPALGLAGGEDGLEVVRRIMATARDFLKPGGILVMEIGHQKQRVESSFPDLPLLWPEIEGQEAGMVFLLPQENLPAL